MFYARSERWSFHAAKTHSGPQDLRKPNGILAILDVIQVTHKQGAV
jgi:hypothetical protein